jgi:hypothetical protein
MKKLSLFFYLVAVLCFINISTIRADGSVSQTNTQPSTTVVQPEQPDSQLKEIDLQNSLQKQQQTIQMLSNISKVLRDTALAVIRKIG